MENKAHTVTVGATIVIAFIAILFYYWYWQDAREAPEEDTITTTGQATTSEPSVAPPSANPLEKVTPEANPIEKTNPFDYENPFE